MAPVRFGDMTCDADLVIFDKDGTLTDFAFMWGTRTVAGIEALTAAACRAHPELGDGVELRRDLFRTWGYDPASEQFASNGPLLTGTMAQLYAIAAGVLFQHGVGWLDADVLVQTVMRPLLAEPLGIDEILPLADLPALFASLQQAGVRVAVVTADDDAPTRRTLEMVGAARFVDFLAGADSGHGVKPAPDPVWAACAATGVEVGRAVMVGDSTTDMLMAQRAGVGLRVAVASGWMSAESLASAADVVLGSIREIGVP